MSLSLSVSLARIGVPMLRFEGSVLVDAAGAVFAGWERWWVVRLPDRDQQRAGGSHPVVSDGVGHRVDRHALIDLVRPAPIDGELVGR